VSRRRTNAGALVVSNVLYFSHPDGRWIEVVLHDQRQLHHDKNRHDRVGGLILGSDPTCDVVLDDDDVEDFHARYFSMGHHQYIAVISGRMEVQGRGTITAGDCVRGGLGIFSTWSIGGWALADRFEPSPELRSALEIAHDAIVEGRIADAVAIGAQAGYRRLEIAAHRQLPERLVAAGRLLRIRVEQGGESSVHALGSFDRLEHGITIGGGTSCDLVLPAAGTNVIELRTTNGDLHLVVDPRAGCVTPIQYLRQAHTTSVKLQYRYGRFEIGDAIFQLCQWPRRDEQTIYHG
jgi:hypothetical protein